MAGHYSKELMEHYMQEEQRQEEKKAKQNQEILGKVKAITEKASDSAKIAFEQTQQNRFEIEALKKELKRSRIISIICICLTIICIAMVMADGLNRVIAMLP